MKHAIALSKHNLAQDRVRMDTYSYKQAALYTYCQQKKERPTDSRRNLGSS